MGNAFSRTGPKSRKILHNLIDSLNDYAAKRGDRIIMRVMPRWISLRSRRGKRVFAELRPSAERIQVFILPSVRDLDHRPPAKRAPSTQGWNWFKSKFYVEGNGDERAILHLLKLSYVFSLRNRQSK